MPMHAGQEWIRHFEHFWTERLDALEAILNEEDKAKGDQDGKSLNSGRFLLRSRLGRMRSGS